MSALVATGGTLAGRILRWLRSARRAGAPAARLPIAGLPDTLGEIPPGELALLLCADEPSRATFLQALLQAHPQQPVAWVCAPSGIPRSIETEIRLAVQRHRLRILTWTEDAALQLRQLGAVHLLRELRTGGVRDEDLLVVEALEPWLASVPADAALESGVAEATRLLVRCAREHQGPVVALAPARHRAQSLLPLLARDKLPRLAALECDAAAGRLDVIRWARPRSGAAHRSATRVAGTRFELARSADGAWRSSAVAPFDAHAAVTAADAGTVHAVRGVLRDAPSTPPNWQVHASLEALLAATTDAVAATVVLAHDRPDALPAVAHAVHRLRSEHPNLLKIVVRETDAAMRRNGELALLRLGANVVMERELGFPFLLQHIESLADVAYGQGPAPDVARTLQALAPEPVQGYLPPLAFCALVERMLDRAAAVRPIARDADARLEHSLVHLPLLPHVAHVDALLACSPRRHGDIVTADARGLYLFLFGCAADDVVAALDALFTMPCSELAHHVRIDPDAGAQRLAIEQLRRCSEQAAADCTAVDYSAILRGMAAAKDGAARPAPVQPAVLPTRAPEPGQRVQPHVLPLRTALA